MKVLFAVSNENISTQIVKKYQKEYKEIISYKNMYYFNAIVKELQRDKSYDRIVISEDLEPFANNNFDAIEKFIFEKLDNISDEAVGTNGKDIPIILLATDKRTKSESILVKLFGIGIYNILLGQDRNVSSVCNLLNKPRSKKEAKMYYKIEAEEVNYKSESENNVSEIEIKNILNHYRKLGKDEERYVESFNNIAAQYNDAQLRIITKFLPLNVKAVLEEQSTKYQSVMTFSDNTPTSELMKKKKEEEGLKVGFLNYTNSNKPTEPVIVPTAVKKVAIKKNTNTITQEEIKPEQDILLDLENMEETNEENSLPGFDAIEELETNNVLSEFDETIFEKEVVQPVKRGRGRPKKIVQEPENAKKNLIKRGRGRPRKIEIQEQEETENLNLPGFDDIVESDEEDILSDFNDINKTETTDVLPGFDDIDENKELDEFEWDKVEDTILPGFDVEDEISEKSNVNQDYEELSGLEMSETLENKQYINSNSFGAISKNNKIVTFVGTTKNGTSFLVNNLGKFLSGSGIKTAILDMTSNKNAYYIYTKNQEQLRNIAKESIKKLSIGIVEGLVVDSNLDVYTALPGDENALENINEIISILQEKYSVILIDSDFSTPQECFKASQEIYIVQTMDILTIQPMTAFLRELKVKEVLDPTKIRIVINKEIKVRDLTPKVIIGGLSNYNDPSMSFMTELFNRKDAKYCTIPFDQKVCSKYLEGVMDCEIKISGYPKEFNKKIKELANMVYPLLEKKVKKLNNYSSNEKFSDNMNSTLEQMKNKY